MNNRIVKESTPLFLLSIGIIIFSFFVFACSNQITTQELSIVTITPALNEKNVPKSISSIALQVSGEDMDTITEEIDVDNEEFTLEIPAGEDREFILTIENASVTFSGTTTEDLTAGEEAEITISLSLESTKLVIPDPEFGSGEYRLVQIDDMDGGGWIDRDRTDYGYLETTDFKPYDVDFDNSGRIYIANNSPDNAGILRINDINDLNPEPIRSESNVVALSVDRENELIYFADNNNGLYRCSLTGASLEGPLIPTTYPLGGICVAPEGEVYLTRNEEGFWAVRKYNPSSGSLDPTILYSTDLNTTPDVLVKDNEVYAADYISFGASGKIIQFDMDLNKTGELSTNPGETDSFLGPRRFVATLNRKIYVIDESSSSNGDDNNRLVSFDGISGSGWDTFSAGDAGKSSFDFYYFC